MLVNQIIGELLPILGLMSRALPVTNENVCTVEPAADGGDSAPAILDAFAKCGQDGKVVFKNETYNVAQVMNTTGLKNCDVEVHGTLLWSTDIDYWLNNSLPVGYQNQSSAWLFGGSNVTMNGFGYGTFDGNGETWYKFINGQSNYPRRPHAITYTGISDAVISGMRYVQSQMWTMTVIHAQNVLLEDIYVNSTSPSGASIINTDGADTIYADNITFRRWTVSNGDDCLSPKANSTNILMEDCDFYNGLGIAMGSIGQYDGQFEFIENVTARDIRFTNMRNTARVKSWTGVAKGYPPNGGGGGIGYCANIHLSNFTATNVNVPWAITQCTSYNGATGDCDTSLFNIRDITLDGLTGTTNPEANGTVAAMQCSAASPCHNIALENINLTVAGTDTPATQYMCDNVEDPVGYTCTGPVTPAISTYVS